MSETYLPDGLPTPTAAPTALTAPYWEGTRPGKLRIQKCRGCGAWQWGPEWICHRCHSFDLAWERSWQRAASTATSGRTIRCIRR